MYVYEKVRNMMNGWDTERDMGLTTPDSIERFDNISYGEYDVWNLLDVYRPKHAEGSLPVIVSVHGGGWVYGDKEVYQHYCMSLAERSFVVVNFNYRLSPDVIYPEHLQDVNAVMHWVKKHIAEYGGDTGRIFMIGDSAGAQMAAMYACALTNVLCREQLSLNVPEITVRGVALNCGAYDMEDCLCRVIDNTSEEEQQELLQTVLGREHREETLPLGCPAAYVTKDFPPAYVMTANGDFLRNQQPLLLDALKKNGVLHEYHEYGDAAQMLYHVFHCNIRTAAAKRCNDAECEFFRKITK